MTYIITFIVVAASVLVISFWWRYRSLACPANLAWLVENPYTNTLVGADKILQRIELAKGMRLLDVGCGPGRLTLPAARQVGNTGEVVALDIQQKMLDKLAAKIQVAGLHNIRLVHAGAGDGKVEHDYFDRALLVTVLGEIPNQARALDEIYRALKPGGILSVTELIPDPHYTSRGRVRELCRAAGFKESDAAGNWFAFTLNFVKPASQ